jgi:hypothetical protein
MRAAELLEQVQSIGVRIEIDGDMVCCRGGGSRPSELIRELRERKDEILSLTVCGKCRAPLSGSIHKFWRVLNGGEAAYLCSAECVFRCLPLEAGGGAQHCYHCGEDPSWVREFC